MTWLSGPFLIECWVVWALISLLSSWLCYVCLLFLTCSYLMVHLLVLYLRSGVLVKETPSRLTFFFLLFVLRPLVRWWRKRRRKIAWEEFTLPYRLSVISNLFFADHTILFCQATRQEADDVLDILTKYANISGQIVNKEKFTMVFSPNTSVMVIQDIQHKLNISSGLLWEISWSPNTYRTL